MLLLLLLFPLLPCPVATIPVAAAVGDGADKVVVSLGPCICKHKVGEKVVD